MAKHLLTGVFRNHRDARQVYGRLLARGYRSDEISLLMSEGTRERYSEDAHGHTEEAGSSAAEGAGGGGAVGTAVVPGVGFVAGPILAALAGGGAGAVTGGVLDGLLGLGIAEPNARAYEDVMKNGGVMVGVVPHDAADAREIRKDFQELEGGNIVASSR